MKEREKEQAGRGHGSCFAGKERHGIKPEL